MYSQHSATFIFILEYDRKTPWLFSMSSHHKDNTFMPHTISQSNLWYFCSYIYEFLAPHVLILRSDILWKHYLWVGHMVQNLKILIFFKTKLKSEDISRGRQLWSEPSCYHSHQGVYGLSYFCLAYLTEDEINGLL